MTEEIVDASLPATLVRVFADERPADAGPLELMVSKLPESSPTTLGAAALSAVVLSGCGGGGGASSAPPPPPPAAAPLTDTQAARFLLQAQFTADDASRAAVISQGYSGWLATQFGAPESYKAWDWMVAKGYSAIDSNNNFLYRKHLDALIWNQMIASPDQLRKRLALALSEVFVIAADQTEYYYWGDFTAAGWWDMLCRNTFGNFRRLLEDVSLSPEMGQFLGTKGNLKENPKTGSEPDENYAREVMQLFTIGLFKLNLDGSRQLDAQGASIPTYAQADVSSLAHVFTGWDEDKSKTIYTSASYPSGGTVVTRMIDDPEHRRLPMVNLASKHSTLEVNFLGTTIPSGTAAIDQLKIGLDTLFNHANVGPFFGRQMIQRLVTSNPSPRYIQRVATAFNDNGSGVRGDLRAVWTAILTDPEATVPSSTNYGGKLREPIVRITQLIRATETTTSDKDWAIGNTNDPSTRLEQMPLEAPSVFNFFLPDYSRPKSAIDALNLVAPEFQIVDELSVASYLNTIASLLSGGLGGFKPALGALSGLATDSKALVDWINLRLAANQLSATTISTIQAAVDALGVTAASTPAKQSEALQTALFLTMASPDFLVQK